MPVPGKLGKLSNFKPRKPSASPLNGLNKGPMKGKIQTPFIKSMSHSSDFMNHSIVWIFLQNGILFFDNALYICAILHFDSNMVDSLLF